MFYLKVAAVNFDNTVFDTGDLSVVRGSSLALLAMPEEVEKALHEAFAHCARIRTVYAKASEAVFRLDPRPASGDPASSAEPQLKRRRGESKQAYRKRLQQMQSAAASAATALPAAEEVEREALEALRKCPARPWNRFTFVTASHLANTSSLAGLRKYMARLDTEVRVRQLQRLTLALPEPGPSPPPAADRLVCSRTGILAADPKLRFPEPISRSAMERRRDGREQKNLFYEEQLQRGGKNGGSPDAELAASSSFSPEARAFVTEATQCVDAMRARLAGSPLLFAESFADMVEKPPDGLPPGVEGKLAVVAMDGNGFGRIAVARMKRGDADFRRYTRWLELRKAALLADLVGWMLERPTMRISREVDGEPSERLRFETLLWGGDEMLFVLPAFEAFSFLERLSTAIGGWRTPEAGMASETLSFAVGVALGQYKTPIRDLKDAAQQLELAAKSDKSGSRLQILALEGIDRADFSLPAVRSARFGENLPDNAFNIDFGRFREVRASLREVTERIGLSQLHRWYRKLEQAGLLGGRNGSPETDAAVAEMRERLLALGAGPQTVDALLKPSSPFGSSDHPFVALHHAVMLRDYVDPLGEMP